MTIMGRLTIDDLVLNDVRVVLASGDDAMKTCNLAEKRKARQLKADARNGGGYCHGREPPDDKV